MKYLSFVLLLLFFIRPLYSQRRMENLDRGLVAYRSGEIPEHICISWRYFSADNIQVKYNLYVAKENSSNGTPGEYTKLNSEPIGNTTFYKYKEPSLMAFRYILKEVINGVEGDSIAAYRLKKFSEGATANYISIPMKQIDGDTGWKYSPNDAAAADLDGDGEMEIVVHRTGESRDNANSGITDSPVLQAYKLDGTFMWEINLGKNIREGAHYTQFMVYDLDGDGKAEVVCKTAEGSKDAAGTFCGKAYFPTYKAQYGLSVNYNENANYRNASGYILQGPEFLTVFDGATGTEVVTTEYDPPRYSTYNNGNEIPILNPTPENINSRWGDNYGNRVDRFLACVANLGGENPSVVMCRGYYTRTVLAAYDYKDKTLTRRWKFDTWNNSALSKYAGQGNHNLRVADIDEDGFDEIIYGSMTVDHDGKGLYTTNLGHGDALHLTDFIPSRPGLEVLACHENKKDGTTLRDAHTGEIIYQISSGDDVGRCMAADIDPRHRGVEWWSSRSGGVRSSADGRVIYGSTSGVSMNMGCWWDGDLLRELQDGTQVTKFNYATGGSSILLNPTGCASNNSTKANPCLQADILGDWREEVILRTSDNKYIRIYMTPYPTGYRFHTFLEDHVYRMSVAYQNVGYNQPTQPGFYFGADLETIFPQKHVSIDENTYTVDPVFDAIAYEWSTGETSKTIVLNRADYPGYDEYPISLKMNFRGYTFLDTIYVQFTSEWSALDAPVQDSAIQLMENPVKNLLSIRFDKGDEYVCRILDLTGKLLKQQTVKVASGQIQTFDVAALHPGVYILKVQGETQRQVIRFIKM